MTKQKNPQDWETISAYIDNELSPADRANFESRLEAEPELRTLLEDMKRTQTLVRSLEPVRAPHNFTLTPEMAGIRSRSFWPAPAFQWASAFATILFVLVIAGDFLGILGPSQLPVDIASETATAVVVQEAAPTLSALMELEEPAMADQENMLEAEEAPLELEEESFSKVGQAPESPLEMEGVGEAEPAPAEPAEDRALDEQALPEQDESASADSPLVTAFRLRVIEVGLASLALILALAAWAFRRRAM